MMADDRFDTKEMLKMVMEHDMEIPKLDKKIQGKIKLIKKERKKLAKKIGKIRKLGKKKEITVPSEALMFAVNNFLLRHDIGNLTLIGPGGQV